MSIIKELLVSLQIVLCVNAQTWSTWTRCSHPETCDTKTELTCTSGKLARCRSNGSLPYQITLSSQCNEDCDAFNNSHWNQPYTQLSCQGTCYDAFQISGYSCTTIQSCRRLEYYRCYNEQTCSGIWKQTGTPTQCSSSCGGGIRSVMLTCVDPSTGMTSYNCNGTYFGRDRKINTSQLCNTHSCPSWSSWNELTSCSVSCGNGTQRVNSTCLYNGTISTLCSDGNNGRRERVASCNTQTCPSWSSWSETTPCSVSCGNGTQRVNSTCIYNGTMSTLCSDGNNGTREREASCNTQTCPTWSSWSEITPCSVSCGNGTQRVNSTCIYNGTMSTLCSDENTTTREENITCNLQACSGGAGITSSVIGIGYTIVVILVFIHCNLYDF